MNTFDTIDNYFTGLLSTPEKIRFEQQLLTDTELAEATAFYVQARQMARQQAQDSRKAGWATLRQRQGVVRQPAWVPMAWAAAACVLLVLGFFLLFHSQPSAPELADHYIQDNLTTLSVTMSGQTDTLQLARQAYNSGQFAEADKLVAILQRPNTDNTEVLKLAGLVALRQGNYDKAIGQFHSLSQRTDLRANPGLLYEAIARLKRNQSGDEATARQLLQTVIDQNLEGKKAAKELIDEL